MAVDNAQDKSSMTENDKLWASVLLLLALKLFDKEKEKENKNERTGD